MFLSNSGIPLYIGGNQPKFLKGGMLQAASFWSSALQRMASIRAETKLFLFDTVSQPRPNHAALHAQARTFPDSHQTSGCHSWEN